MFSYWIKELAKLIKMVWVVILDIFYKKEAKIKFKTEFTESKTCSNKL